MHTQIAQLQTVPACLPSHGTIKLVSAGFEEFRVEIEGSHLQEDPAMKYSV
jgi:Asp-tRNA(Asn)/Glu-tRNA(Gln) amidotransferase B subunit